MDEKTKLYVFDKKEALLLFIFMILIATTSFTLGVKVGTNYSFEKAGYSESDRAAADNVSMQSEDEEGAMQNIAEHAQAEKKKEETLDDTQKALQEEFNKLDSNLNGGNGQGDQAMAKPVAKVETQIVQPAPTPVPVEMTDKKDVKMKDVSRNDYVGKYTIQLGSYQALTDAQKFADGFKIRGYDPIINEVRIKGRGIWYRVSLGVFETLEQAKAYVEGEKTLFETTDHVFGKLE